MTSNCTCAIPDSFNVRPQDLVNPRCPIHGNVKAISTPLPPPGSAGVSRLGHPAPDGNTFTLAEMRIALTAFAIWLNQHRLPAELAKHRGREVELVDQFFEETT